MTPVEALISEHDARIASAWAALQGARAAATRCPTADTLRLEAMCERTLDDLLDCRPKGGTT